MKRLMAAALVAGGMLGGPITTGLAAPIYTIDFEDGTAPTAGPEVVAHYSVGGIDLDFIGAGYRSSPKATSGNLGITQYVPVYNGQAFIGFEPIEVTFSEAVSAVSVYSIYAAGNWDGLITSSITAYDGAGNVVGSDSFSHVDEYIIGIPYLLSVDAAAIYSISLSGYVFVSDGLGNSVTFDDLSIAPVPLPAAAWLLLSAFGGLCLMGWGTNFAAASRR